MWNCRLIYAGIPTEERMERAKGALAAGGHGMRGMSHTAESELSGGQRHTCGDCASTGKIGRLIMPGRRAAGNLDSQTGVENHGAVRSAPVLRGTRSILVTQRTRYF